MTDYPEISRYIDEHERQIKHDFDMEYPYLSKKEKKQAILQTFFSQNGGDYKHKYDASAQKLVEGLEPYYRGYVKEQPLERGIQVQEKRTSYKQVKYKSGRSQFVYRLTSGRFGSLRK